MIILCKQNFKKNQKKNSKKNSKLKKKIGRKIKKIKIIKKNNKKFKNKQQRFF